MGQERDGELNLVSRHAAQHTSDSLVIHEWLEADSALEVAFFAVRLRFIFTLTLGQSGRVRLT